MSEVRLIDANALKKALKDAHINMELTFDIATFNCVMNTIDNAPTVEDRSREVLSLQETIRKLTKERPQGDLISRDALKKDIDFQFICECCHNNGNTCDICPVAEIEKKIDDAQAVETSKIEHKAYNEGFKDGVEQGIKLSHLQGKWIVLFAENNIKTCKCSICGRIEDIADFDKYPFCHCGAQMYELKTS